VRVNGNEVLCGR
jgi:hypothetical protein